jgi:3-oxoacid CoA-transferase subunit A
LISGSGSPGYVFENINVTGATVIANGYTVGGFAIHCFDVKNSKFTGNVSGLNYVGGFCGGASAALSSNSNLIFKGTARNFNACMAGAAKITIAEVEELVPAGTLNPNEIHIPGIMVNRIFQGEKFEKRIEQRTVRQK